MPVLVAAACFAHGTTVIRDAAELRMKETDRITAMVQELRNMGAVIQELPDGIVIEGAECVSVSYPEFWEHLETMTKRDVLAE